MKVRVYYNAGLNEYCAQYEHFILGESTWKCFEHFDPKFGTITLASFKTSDDAILFLNDLKQKTIKQQKLRKLDKVVFEDVISD